MSPYNRRDEEGIDVTNESYPENLQLGQYNATSTESNQESAYRLGEELRYNSYYDISYRNRNAGSSNRNSAYDSLLMEPINDPGAEALEGNEKKSVVRGPRRRLFRSWVWEIGACFLSLASIASVIAVLSVENHKPLDQWAWSIGPTAVVSFIAAIAKSTMLVATVEVLSQLKWQHFHGQTHPLIDLEIFDGASRGPFGAVQLLWKKNIRTLLASLAAIVVIVSMLVDPFVQLVFEFPALSLPVSTASALLNQTQVYDPNGYIIDAHLTGTTASAVDAQMQAAIIKAVSEQPQPPAAACSTGNCTWPPITTLGVCADCTDVTRQVNISCPGPTSANHGQYQCDYGMPSGRNISGFMFRAGASGDVFPTRWNSSAVSHGNTPGGAGSDALLAYIEAVQLKAAFNYDTDMSSMLRQPTAWTCTFALCAKTYDSLSMTNGKMSITTPTEDPMVLTGNITNGTTPIGGGLSGLSFYRGLKVNSSSSSEETYRINQADYANLANYLTELFSTGWGERGFGASNRVQQSTAPNLGWGLSEADDLSRTVRSIAEGMTEIMRNSRNSTPIAGEALRTQIYIEVQWGWIALPLTLIVLSLFLLVVMIVRTHRSDLPVWKSSSIALLSHEVNGWAPGGGVIRETSTLQKEARDISVMLPSDSQDMRYDPEILQVIAMAQKRTILITGCSDGSLGSALALAFHKIGWRVFASARNPSKLKEAEFAGIETIQLDVLSEKSIADGVTKVKELTGGSLDAVLNNAGAGYSLPLMDIDIGKAQELFDLNVFSIIRMTRAFLPLLIESGSMVVNNTSAVSVPAGAVPFQGAYNASKAAAANLTEVMRLELAPFGVKVINLVTGSVQSTFFDNAPTAILPPTSLYNIAKEAIEKAMGYDTSTKSFGDPNQWANQVANDVSRPHPPHWVWRGQYTLQVRIASLLPIGYFDSFKKKLAGLDVLERKIQEQGGASKVKTS
ncbi:hypothetical protein F4813DRAFT_395758 [Daldinia decipiens]|uniref:uncharacterized protein n=1 Tax=Daldinia decipiens TaxID=326647 RepID=UPI0020C24DCF|nr:uncharacterized protein F4813DRAFT_395758 [Daldinia decipiens]KAI1658412.1 hypothetical protein F4813DRAFT_395758 [Daldinia decipiens]